jgi:hypothetical protein
MFNQLKLKQMAKENKSPLAPSGGISPDSDTSTGSVTDVSEEPADQRVSGIKASVQAMLDEMQAAADARSEAAVLRQAQ